MKCDACLTGAAVSTGVQFSMITEPGRRVVAQLDLCEICQACSQHIADAIVRKGVAWTVSPGWRREEERESVTAPAPPPPRPKTASPDDVSVARASGYTGSVCGNCGSLKMVRTGTCETCQDCHSPSGGCL